LLENIRYRAGPILKFETGSTDAAFYAPDIFASGPVKSEIFLLVAKCRTFKTLREHARDRWNELSFRKKRIYIRTISSTYSEQFGSIIIGRHAFIRMLEEIFLELSKQGCFIAENAFCEIVQKAERVLTPKLQSLGVITCNRPENLKTNLASYMQNTQTYGRNIDFVICDDSQERDMQEKNQQIATEYGRKLKRSVYYIGLEEKKVFANHLKSRGLSPEVIDFALFDSDQSRYSYGANCNSFYLHTAGELAFVTDDDTICQLFPSLDYEDGISLGAQGNILPHWYFENRDDALKSCRSENIDLIGLHEKVLGKSVTECVSELKSVEYLKIDGLNNINLSQVLRNAGRVRLSHNGLLGDSGSNSPRSYLFSFDDQRKRLLKNESAYRSAFKSRETLKVAPRLTLHPAGVCMSTFYAADNREVLPPFFPIFRDCDSLFGEMLAACDRDNYFAYLPWALLHSPPEQRAYHGVQSVLIDGFGTTDIIRNIFETFSPHPGNSVMPTNIKKAGQHLIEFGEMPFRDYRRIVVESLFRKRCEDLANLRAVYEMHSDSPSYWKKDMEMLLKSSERQLTKKLYLTDPQLASRFGPEESEKLNQRYIYRFGQLCSEWPEIFNASLELKSNGIRLGKKLV
jgi:hypothetical protein